MMMACSNCSAEDERDSGAPLTRGLCPQCWDAYRRGLNEVLSEAIAMRDQLRAIGDEAGNAAADAYQVIVRFVRGKLREPKSDG